jgi:cytochrome c
MRKMVGICGLMAGSLVAAAAWGYTAEQAQKGKEVYGLHCANCHGAEGHGGKVPDSVPGYAGMKAPPVAGKGALPNMETAENVFMFVKQHMPLQKPGTLTDQQCLDIVAFDMMANNMGKPNDKPLTTEGLSGMKLHKK